MNNLIFIKLSKKQLFKTIAFCVIALILIPLVSNADKKTFSAKEIIRLSDEHMRGKTNITELSMTVIKPAWKRTITMKSWEKEKKYMLILITNPARDRGTVFLKRDTELWNWLPTIERVIKIPPSMMTQSWMGSDFTNDDLVKESSIVKDYTHEIMSEEIIDGYKAYKIKLTPLPDAAVVWGKLIMWITKDNYLQLRTEFYDEDEILINILTGSKIKELGGRTLPTRMEMIPVTKKGHSTLLEYKSIKFNAPLNESFFSLSNMRRIK